MCSPSNISCHTNKPTGLNNHSQNSDAQTNIVLTRDILPSATSIAPREIPTPDQTQEKEQKSMNNFIYGSIRTNSPQYMMNSEEKGILREVSLPNAFLSKPPLSKPPLSDQHNRISLPNLSKNNSTSHPNKCTENSYNNKIMPSLTPPEISSKSNVAHIEENESKHELSDPYSGNPPSLMLLLDKRQYLECEHLVKDSPSPRDVTKDMQLYKRLDIPESINNQQGIYHHKHQMEFQPLPQSIWPQTYVSSSPHRGEIRKEPSPPSSASNSSITHPDDWSSNTDGIHLTGDGPHSSPSTSRSQHYISSPMYHPPTARPRLPFNLKPRPSNTYQAPPKQFKTQPQAHYAQFWGQQPASYHTHSQVSPISNNATSLYHTRQTHPTQPPSPLSSGNTSTNGNTSPPARTAPEILKTLLRKKACLYEPGTSRAIALLTWLVARRLALQYGYFSRQHLQSGVHAIVRNKISRGIITRTKVNRCMQVILNSCFYYIIPKPDGTEESGESFRHMFEETVVDDTALIKTLPEPWNDLEIDENILLDRNCCSPTLADMKEEHDDNERGYANNKRQVLLCFNENVRSAEDVLRCHNDFIRDSAISANLALTPEEWRSFYLCEDELKKKEATKNIDDSYLSFDMPTDVEESLAFKESISNSQCQVVDDSLGQMTMSELGQFRTTWCCKRYEHDATLCRFAHIDLNKGWLRRNPSQFEYSTIMCPNTSTINNKASGLNGCYINACKDGIHCKFAHSTEEVAYHPTNYKRKICEWTKKGLCHPCDMRDICPFIHPCNNSLTPTRSTTRHNTRRINDNSGRIKGHLIGGKHPNPNIGSTGVGSYTRAGAPMLYLSPAPKSEFDKTLLFPGLSSLYRRNCATHYAHDTGSKEIEYSNFGDYWEQSASLPSIGNSTEKTSFSLFGVV